VVVGVGAWRRWSVRCTSCARGRSSCCTTKPASRPCCTRSCDDCRAVVLRATLPHTLRSLSAAPAPVAVVVVVEVVLEVVLEVVVLVVVRAAAPRCLDGS